MRGSVIALTDEDGYIVETYSYDLFGNILSTPTIYNSKLFIGRDDVLYDTETDLYYMHARYYDPEAGRFIMKDQTEGSPPNSINYGFRIKCGMTFSCHSRESRNPFFSFLCHSQLDWESIILSFINVKRRNIPWILYQVQNDIRGVGMTIKICANDPINKIDPAGTTPQNTGLPPRYENEPQAVKWAGSNRTAFCTPPIANPADLLNGPIGPVASGQEQGIKLWSPEDGYGNDVWLKGDAMDTFVSCGKNHILYELHQSGS